MASRDSAIAMCGLRKTRLFRPLRAHVQHAPFTRIFFLPFFFILSHSQGLTVYCTVSVAGADYPCSLSTFSAPGNGRAVIAPISAPLYLVASPELPGELSRGCGLDDAAAATGKGATGVHGDSSSAAAAASATTTEPTQPKGWRRWLRKVRKLSGTIIARFPSSLSAPAIGRPAPTGRHGTASGSIIVVSRGECTFEEKVGDVPLASAYLGGVYLVALVGPSLLCGWCSW